MDESDIDHRFAFHSTSRDLHADEHGMAREGCRALAHVLNRLLPDGREKSLALTHLEDTMMWANAAIARQTP